MSSYLVIFQSQVNNCEGKQGKDLPGSVCVHGFINCCDNFEEVYIDVVPFCSHRLTIRKAEWDN